MIAFALPKSLAKAAAAPTWAYPRVHKHSFLSGIEIYGPDRFGSDNPRKPHSFFLPFLPAVDDRRTDARALNEIGYFPLCGS